jgi:hypothetical protein
MDTLHSGFIMSPGGTSMLGWINDPISSGGEAKVIAIYLGTTTWIWLS